MLFMDSHCSHRHYWLIAHKVHNYQLFSISSFYVEVVLENPLFCLDIYTENIFLDMITKTIGINMKTKYFNIDGNKVKLQK